MPAGGTLFHDINSVKLIYLHDSFFMTFVVIYDDDLTDAFLKTVEKLLHLNPKAIVYISLERR